MVFIVWPAKMKAVQKPNVYSQMLFVKRRGRTYIPRRMRERQFKHALIAFSSPEPPFFCNVVGNANLV